MAFKSKVNSQTSKKYFRTFIGALQSLLKQKKVQKQKCEKVHEKVFLKYLLTKEKKI